MRYIRLLTEMNHKKFRTVLAAGLLFLLYLIIFEFSGQDGEESGSLSLFISEKCAEFVNAIGNKHWTEQMLQSMAVYFEHPIRKLAHFSEYACMGVLVHSMWRPWIDRNKRLYLLTVCWVFVSAAVDEFHQSFVPGRYCSFADVLLDTCGGIFGIFICIWFCKIVTAVKRKKS